MPATRRLRRIQGATAATLVVAAMTASCDGGSREREEALLALQQRRAQLITQNASVQNQIRQTQAQALDDSVVASLRGEFYDRLRSRMIALDPRAEGWLDRAVEIGNELAVVGSPQILTPGEQPPSRERTQAAVRDFAEMEKTLLPIQEAAMQDPEVARAFATLQDTLTAVMVRIDPGARTTLDQIARIEAALGELDREIAALTP